MTTVTVTGANHPTGLGIARALGDLGCEIIGLYQGDETYCCKSRYWSQLIRFRNSDEIIDLLVCLGKKRTEKSVLFMVEDSVVKLVSDNRAILRPFYHFLLPSREVVDLFLDKAAFQEWAQEHDFLLPRSTVCESWNQLLRALDNIELPAIIKPYEKTDAWEKASPLDKTIRINAKSDLEVIRFDLFSVSEKILVQQWVPGGDDSIYYCLMYYDEQGKEVAYYTGKKLFQWPPYCGSTAAAVGVHNEEVHRITKSLFDKAGYRGLGSLELKLNSLDNKFYLIEPTVGRNDLQSNVAVAGGVNLSKLAFCDLVGLERPQFHRKRGSWIHEEALLDSLRCYQMRGYLLYKKILPLLSIHIKFAYFDRRDLLPFIQLATERIKRKIPGLLLL